MKVIALIVDEHPRRASDCPFSCGDDWSPYCCMGGKCELRFNNRCGRLTVPFTCGESNEYWADNEEED